MAKPKSGQRIKHMLIHEFTLKNPLNDGCPYDEYAAKVIQAILVRLSILPNLIQDSADAHVSGLTVNGESDCKWRILPGCWHRVNKGAIPAEHPQCSLHNQNFSCTASVSVEDAELCVSIRAAATPACHGLVLCGFLLELSAGQLPSCACMVRSMLRSTRIFVTGAIGVERCDARCRFRRSAAALKRCRRGTCLLSCNIFPNRAPLMRCSSPHTCVGAFCDSH
jgi:hypothetical protein